MTKYKLEDFKNWLEEETNRQEGLSWSSQWNRIDNDEVLKNLIKKEDYYRDGQILCSFNSSPSWEPYYQVVLKWKNEIDNQQNNNESKIIELNQEIISLKQENERLRNRQLNDNEKEVITFFQEEIPQSNLNTRLMTAKRMLTILKSNDLSVKANPNLSAQGISLPERLASSFEQIVWICEFYFQMEKRLNQTIKDLEDQIQELENEQDNEYKKTKELNDILFSKQISSETDYNLIKQELKRLKIQDLTLQIPLKKQELEQNTNNLKNNLNNSGKYLLEKLLKKQKKLLQSNENNSEKLEEMKQILKEDLGNSSERLQELLNKQKELFNLEKHLENLQNEQVAQIIHNPPRNN